MNPEEFYAQLETFDLFLNDQQKNNLNAILSFSLSGMKKLTLRQLQRKRSLSQAFL